MFDASLLFGGASVYSPWFPRAGDLLRVVAECVAVSGGTLTIRVFGKNSDDTGDGTDINSGTTIVLSSVGFSPATEWASPSPPTTGVKQLLRFQFTVSGSGANWVLYRLLPAVWFDAVKA